MSLISTGVFSISLDFELHWGSFDHTPLKKVEDYFFTTKETIPEILNLFKQFNIEATWATVGMLFNKSIEDIKENFPERLPSYKNEKISPYQFINLSIETGKDIFYTAQELIELIKNTKGQEIGSHTYSHYYVLEQGQCKEEFEADIIKHKEVASRMGVELKSIVFPRNQINSNYFEICNAHGISITRVNPKKWVWKYRSKGFLKIISEIFRSLDCYLYIFNNNIPLSAIEEHEKQIRIPFSRFLRPISGNRFLDKLRIYRIKNEMTRAAKHKCYYHLWWHPHNFGRTPIKALKELKSILLHYQKLNEKYGMISLNMNNTHKLIT